MKKDSEYYYGVPAIYFMNLPYKEALEAKIRYGKSLRHSLVKEQDKMHTKRCDDVDKAIDLNNRLLDKLKD